MYFRYADHFPSRISSMCKLSSVVKAIEEKLTKRQLSMFKKDIFGHFLECRSFPFSGVILHNLLLRQVAHEEDSREDQLWFQIDEHLIRLSIVEWCLVTGLSFGVDTNKKNDEMEQRLRNTYFGGVHRKINVNQFDAVFKELKFEEIDDMDALKIALFYFTDRVLNARKNHCQINFDWLDQVDDIQYFRKRPWGLLSWEMIYESLDNALFEKDEKFKKTRLNESPRLGATGCLSPEAWCDRLPVAPSKVRQVPVAPSVGTTGNLSPDSPIDSPTTQFSKTRK
ncbi:hypothetical protein CUMW_205870 [Citrus unshiu]|uniref:DUF1985 domain-containing protein n=1 Tax=Citrus unshiu TaxID=55188 RepID=A0A2H5Q8F5_CITUN|nr:hypothetical protein CUMW_205870 [Citrus unshiu]